MNKRFPTRTLAAIAVGVVLTTSLAWKLTRSPDHHPEDIVTKHMQEALAAIDRSDMEAAGNSLDIVLDREPLHAKALLYRGQLRRETGDLDGALADWRHVPVDVPVDRGIAAYLQSTVLLEQGDAVEAERLLLESMRLHPTYAQPQQRLLELYVVQLRRDDVHEHLQRLRNERSWTIEELVFSMVPLERATTPDSGAKLMRRYVAERPDDVHSRRALGAYLMLEGRTAEARDILLPLHREHPQDETTVAWLAQSLISLGEVNAARETLSSFPAEMSTSPHLLRSWGLLELASKRWEAAIDHLSSAVRLAPEDLPSCYQLGQTLRRIGHDELAEFYLRRAELTDQLQSEALRLVWGSRDKIAPMTEIANGVGETLLELDRPDDAAEWFRQVLAVAPGSSKAVSGLQRAVQLAANDASRDRPKAIEIEMQQAGPSPGNSPGGGIAPGSSDAPTIRFSDVHALAGLDFQYFNGATRFKYLVESTGGGVAVLDFDRDGWPDLYFPQGCHLTEDGETSVYLDQLWRNRRGQSYEQVTERSRIVEPRYGQGIAAGDLDNDGFPDLVIANFGRNTCLRNNGDGTFTDITEQVGLKGEVMSSSVALADLNRDGRLDVYIANYVDSMKVCQNSDGTFSTCNPSNFEGEQDRLYLNDGRGGLSDVTAESSITAPGGKGLGVVVCDLNVDGWPDIYVANDTTPNFYFRNLGNADVPSFSEIGLASGVALSGEGRAQAGMGIACGDFDGNGLPDLHVTNFFQETNTLYLNEGADLFSDATQSSGLAAPSHGLLGFGTQAADFNRDGHLDLFVANGHIDDFRARGEPWKMPPQLYQNPGGARFTDASSSSGEYFEGRYLGRGVARLDWNRDGLDDLVVVHQDRAAALLQNETPGAGQAVTLEFVGIQSNRDAIGTRVIATANGTVQTHEVIGGDGYFASNQKTLTIGVGASSQVDRIEVVWPSGHRDRFENIPCGSRLLLIEGAAEPVSIN
jgi:tetratricopeptide (TPR) repeat protein